MSNLNENDNVNNVSTKEEESMSLLTNTDTSRLHVTTASTSTSNTSSSTTSNSNDMISRSSVTTCSAGEDSDNLAERSRFFLELKMLELLLDKFVKSMTLKLLINTQNYIINHHPLPSLIYMSANVTVSWTLVACFLTLKAYALKLIHSLLTYSITLLPVRCLFTHCPSFVLSTYDGDTSTCPYFDLNCFNFSKNSSHVCFLDARRPS